MPQVELIMPKMGESVAEATITKWLKKEGDPIAQDEAVLEIATDKVDSEIPSPYSGILGKILFQEGQVVQVGKAVAVINTETGAVVSKPETSLPSAKAEPVKELVKTEDVPASFSKENKLTAASGRFYSPLVRNIAKQEGISLSELEKISGTGHEGRVTKNDILAYIPKRSQSEKTESLSKSEIWKEQSATNGSSHVKPAMSVGAGDEIIEMDRMRKLIADHMVMSKHTSPHVTSFVEADVTNLVLWRDKV